MKKALTCIVLLVASSFSLADTGIGVYVGAGVGFIPTKANDAFDKEVSFKAGEVFAGAYWKWIGIETRSGQSADDEIIDVGQDPDTGEFITAKTALTGYESYFLRLQAQNEVGRIYLLLGTSDVHTTSTFSDGRVVDVVGSGQAWGIGAGFYVNDNLNFNIEYKSLYEDDELSLPMTGANVDFHFW